MNLLKPLGDEVSLVIDAPPAEVWDLVSDVTRIGEFSPETFEAKWTRGSTGPEVGAYFAGHVKRNGVGPTYWSPCRVTVCEPERTFEFSVGTDSVTVNNWGYRLEAEGTGTRVTETWTDHRTGWPDWTTAVFDRIATRKPGFHVFQRSNIAQTLKNLKADFES